MTMRNPRLLIALPWTAVAVAIAFVVVGALRRKPAEEFRAQLSAIEQLASLDTEGYALAEGPREFAFPADHGPHDGFRTEWWYFTGNLAGDAGEHFGYQLTFFRIALAPNETPRASKWATSHVWMAHFALSDVGGERFTAFERLEREAHDLPGARADPWRVWTRDWSASSDSASAFPLRLSAAHDDVAIELELSAAKPPALQGERGLSRKSGARGNASYYYSMTRLATVGTVRRGDRSIAVRGSSWMDREWSTSALDADQVGWDWFALELSDGRELMYYRLRLRDGSIDPFSQGSLIALDGSVEPLAAEDVVIRELAQWTSPHTRAVYPSRWRLTVPSRALELEIDPALEDQELRVSVTYWEGAVLVRGTALGAPIEGRGYVELVGYED